MKSKSKKAAPARKGEITPPPPPAPKGLPELPGCEVELDWRDFKGLLEARLAAGPKSAPEPVPVPYVVGSVRGEGRVEREAARLTLTTSIEVLASGWVFVPLVEGELAISRADLDGHAATLTGRGNQLGILMEGPQRASLELEICVPLVVNAAQSGLAFGLPSAPALELDLLLPGEDELDLAIQPVVCQDVRREGKATRLTASIPAPARVEIRWTLTLPEEPSAEETVEPVLQAQVQTLAQVGDGTVRFQSLFEIDVLRAPVRTFTIDVPPGQVVTDVSAPGMVHQDSSDEGDCERLRVLLEQAVEGSVRIEVHSEAQLSEAGEATLRAPRLVGALRDQGHLALAPLTNVDVTTPVIEGARRVDPRELPPQLSRRASRAILHAFHYAGTEPRVELLVTKHPELPVLTTVVDRAAFLVLVTEDGQRYVQGRYTVRNAQQQFLRVELGPDEELLSALLEEEPVKPAQGGEHVVLIPLRRASSPSEAESPFTVELVTRTPLVALSERGALEIELPRVELPVAYLTCDLHLPRGYVYDDFEGSLREVDGFQNPLVTRADLMSRWVQEDPRPSIHPPARMAARSRQAAPSMEAMGVENIAQAMDFESEEMMSLEDNLGGGGRGASDPFGAPPSPPRLLAQEDDGGRLPIRIEIPKQGERFRFERLLCLGEELTLQTEYTRERR
ncbi:MAG: hypothetical protein JKY65_22355 [Planctomycetes bacterium]|nr:hypothetical protein [Planctomycetota bacterium]